MKIQRFRFTHLRSISHRLRPKTWAHRARLQLLLESLGDLRDEQGDRGEDGAGLQRGQHQRQLAIHERGQGGHETTQEGRRGTQGQRLQALPKHLRPRGETGEKDLHMARREAIAQLFEGYMHVTPSFSSGPRVRHLQSHSKLMQIDHPIQPATRLGEETLVLRGRLSH